MITATASAMHGYDTASKWIIVAVNGAAYCGIGCAVFGWCGLFFAPVVVAWWLLLRGGKQAQIELQKMDAINAPNPTYMDVMRVHYYTGILTCVGLCFFNYKRTPHLINKNAFWDCRRPTEFCSGLTFDLAAMGVILCLM